MTLAPGQTVADRYQLLARIGAGGMAEVWCAEDQMLNRRVALKFLHERFTQDQQFAERFRREASAAAGLQHPNVVGVFDRGVWDGAPYIAMEYVEGASLKDLIGRGLAPAEAVEIVRQVLAGAGFAHAKGIVHRDLKPQNVLVDGEGRARVTDFGIARAGVSEITQTGSVLGTAHYLPPEQAQGLPVTAASDIYSIGVLLYEALTGTVPFEGDSAVSVALKQVSERPRPPSQLSPAVSPALDAVVLKALAKDPANRFQSADEFIRALDAAEANPTAPIGDTAAFGAVAAAGAAEVTDPTALAPAAAAEPVPVAEQAEEEEEVPPSRRRLLTRRRAIILALLLLLAGGAVAAYALTRPETATVPQVLHQSEDHARAVLRKAGFEVKVKDLSSEEPKGQVLKQDPPADSEVDQGSTVTLTVSAGPGKVKVPDVSGLAEDEAEKMLRDKGFRSKVTTSHSGAVRRGLVIATQPPAGMSLAPGKVVTLVVSAGPKQVAVPSIVGDQQAVAQDEVQQAGLVPNVQTRNADEPEGQVIDQIPDAGAKLRKGETVTIVVSTGAGSVIVQNVVGQPEGTASTMLRSQGLNVSVQEQSTDTKSQDGRVLGQAPDAGTRVRRGSTVTIFVGQFQQPTTTTAPPSTTTQTTTTSSSSTPR